MGQPGLAQDLEAGPAVVGSQGNAEDVAHLAVEIGQVALWMMDGRHGQVAHARQAIREQAQRHALARAGVAMDHGKAALADLGVLDAPAEVLHARGHVDGLGGQLLGEGIPFDPVQGEQFVVHGLLSCSGLGDAKANGMLGGDGTGDADGSHR